MIGLQVPCCFPNHTVLVPVECLFFKVNRIRFPWWVVMHKCCHGHFPLPTIHGEIRGMIPPCSPLRFETATQQFQSHLLCPHSEARLFSGIMYRRTAWI